MQAPMPLGTCSVGQMTSPKIAMMRTAQAQMNQLMILNASFFRHAWRVSSHIIRPNRLRKIVSTRLGTGTTPCGRTPAPAHPHLLDNLVSFPPLTSSTIKPCRHF